jgi:hypothetical protein
MENDIRERLIEHDHQVKSGTFIFDNTAGCDMKEGFTLALCFSRRWCVRPFFDAFNKLELPMKDCHLLIFCNKDSVLLENDLLERAKVYSDAFKSVRLYSSYRKCKGTNSLIPSDPEHRGKLPYIYAMYLDIVDLVTTDRFVSLEDDTLVPPDAVTRLLSTLSDHGNKAFVSGIETNRGPYEDVKTRLGVHYIKRRGNRILERVSLDPDTRGIVPVDAAGWYCFATTRDIFLSGFLGIEKYFYEIPRFALDMFHTNNLRQRGVPIIADFDIWCYHIEPRATDILLWGKEQAVEMADYWIAKYGVYAEGIIMNREAASRSKIRPKSVPIWH